MPIRRIRNTAANEQQLATKVRTEIPSPPPRRRADTNKSCEPVPAAPPAHAAEATMPRQQKRGHARKGDNGKWQPTGDYKTGFAKPPKQHQFDGSKAGPGRPKGSRSQDSYWREELDAVRTIRIDGVPTKVKSRQLLAKVTLANALEKRSEKALASANDNARRLFPDAGPAEMAVSPFGDASTDEAVLRQLFSGLALGEPKEGMNDPLFDLLREPLGPQADDDEDWDDGVWDEEEWNAPGEESGDE